MGYVFNFHDALTYDQWYSDHHNNLASELETRLMLQLLEPSSSGETAIDIGCGTGAALSSLQKKGLNVTGIDPSPYMLDIACKNLTNKADLYRGVAEDLPFEDNSFNYACFFTSLEFVENPEKAIEEACRVAKDKIFIGVLNKYAIKGFQRRVKGIFSKTIFNKAKFFSIWELKYMIKKTLGDIPVKWRSVYQFPNISVSIVNRIENYDFIQRVPFGTFIGISATLIPKFKTKPLTLKYKTTKKVNTVIEGYAGRQVVTKRNLSNFCVRK